MQQWIRSKLWPTFECEDCIGMKQYGCWCDKQEDVWTAGKEASWIIKLLRKGYYKIWPKSHGF